MQAPTAQPVRRRFTVDEYYHLAEIGILAEDDRVELIDGDIVEMTPISAHHAGGVNALTAHFTRMLGDRVVAAVQNPVRLDDFNEPQPDFCLLKPRDDLYRAKHPDAADVLLLVEVAHTSRGYDRRTKAPIYARYGVREYWIVDVANRAIEVYRDPAAGDYGRREEMRAGDSVAPEAFPDATIEVSELVGSD